VTGDQLRRAVDDLLDSSQRITRNLLGVGGYPGDETDPGIADGLGQPFSAPMPHPTGRFGFVSMPGRPYRKGGWSRG
jgi:hypothetical protein